MVAKCLPIPRSPLSSIGRVIAISETESDCKGSATITVEQFAREPSVPLGNCNYVDRAARFKGPFPKNPSYSQQRRAPFIRTYGPVNKAGRSPKIDCLWEGPAPCGRVPSTDNSSKWVRWVHTRAFSGSNVTGAIQTTFPSTPVFRTRGRGLKHHTTLFVSCGA